MAIDKQAVDFLKNKGIKPSFSYKDIWQNEHAHSFTVAKIMQADVLQDIKDAMVDALANGKTLKQFQEELIPTLQKKGWWGEKEVIDPKTGEMVTTNINPRRLKVIYESNKRAARAAGVWARAQATKKFAPYFEYKLGPSRHHRAQHVEFEGIIREIDDDFWNMHYPPNGWGCKCYVTQITKRQAESKGGVSKLPKIEYQNYQNVRTGEISRVPKGVNPAWSSNTGKYRTQQLNNLLEEKLLEVDENIANTVIKDCISSSYFKQQMELAKEVANNSFKGDVEQAKQEFLPVAITSKKLQDLLNIKHQRVVRFSGYTAIKGATKHKDITQSEYLLLQQGVDSFTEHKVENSSVIIFFNHEDSLYKAVVKRTSKDEVYLSTLFRIKERKKNNYLSK